MGRVLDQNVILEPRSTRRSRKGIRGASQILIQFHSEARQYRARNLLSFLQNQVPRRLRSQHAIRYSFSTSFGLSAASIFSSRQGDPMKALRNGSVRTFAALGLMIIMTGSVFAASNIYDFTLPSIDGKPVPLADFKGKVVLVVNVASRCGFTPQYSALQALYEKYKDQGFVIVGFPANNFGAQEPGTNQEIKTFCSRKYNVTFPLYSKVSVKGDDQTPLYQYLTKQTGPSIAGEIKWNFTKFLVDRNGNVVQRFESAVTPDSKEVVSAVEKQLGQK
jgi:glutathione peroxidase